MLRIVQQKGVKFGKLQVVDSVHLVADVNLGKDKQRQREGKSPRDKDATWGVKAKQSQFSSLSSLLWQNY